MDRFWNQSISVFARGKTLAGHKDKERAYDRICVQDYKSFQFRYNLFDLQMS